MYRVPQELIFNLNPEWRILPYLPEVGTVGCFSADRVPSWGHFIVVGFNREKRTMDVITPHMRLINNVLEFGKANVMETVSCTCEDGGYLNDGCICGADVMNEKLWHDSFNVMEEFEATTIPIVHRDGYIYMELVQKHTLKPYYNFEASYVEEILRKNIT
jgi:hypothetical protein